MPRAGPCSPRSNPFLACVHPTFPPRPSVPLFLLRTPDFIVAVITCDDISNPAGFLTSHHRCAGLNSISDLAVPKSPPFRRILPHSAHHDGYNAPPGRRCRALYVFPTILSSSPVRPSGPLRPFRWMASSSMLLTYRRDCEVELSRAQH